MEENIQPNLGSAVHREKKNLQGVYIFFVSLNQMMYFLKADVLGYRQTSWAFSDRATWRKGK